MDDTDKFLNEIKAMCGMPDAVEACRLIIQKINSAQGPVSIVIRPSGPMITYDTHPSSSYRWYVAIIEETGEVLCQHNCENDLEAIKYLDHGRRYKYDEWFPNGWTMDSDFTSIYKLTLCGSTPREYPVP